MTVTPSVQFDRAIKIVAILVMFVIMTAIATNLRFTLQTDFVSFWAASKLALAGTPAAAYDLDLHRSMEMTAVAIEGTIPFTYPPPYLFAVFALGLLPYAVAHAVWVLTTLSAFVAATQKLIPGGGILALAFPPAIICGIGGQNSFLIAAIMITGMILLRFQPFAAGLMFGLIVFKPHLGLLLPLALLAGREWRAFAAATVSTVALVFFSVAAFGLASWEGFLALIPLAGNVAAAGLVSWNKMASLFAALRLLGMPAYLAAVIHLAVAIAACIIVWRVWRMSSDAVLRAAVLGSATLLISPYVFIYDQVLLVPALAYLWQRSSNRRALSLAYMISGLGLAGNFYSAATLNIAPIVPVMLLALIWRDFRFGSLADRPYAAFGADSRTPSST